LITRRSILIKFTAIILLLIILSFITACSNGLNSVNLHKDDLLVISSIPETGGIVESSLQEIMVTFNNTISEIHQLILRDETDNIELTELNQEIQNKTVKVTGFSLTPTHSYQLSFEVIDENGNRLTGLIDFTVERDTYPVVNEPNQTMMQAFYWEMNEGDYAAKYPEEANLWNLLAARASELAEVGITALWLPPANKGMSGTDDVGYGTYDLWDLGEFQQKGTVRTKYGTKSELETALSAIHNAGLKAYYDAVFNHRMGADGTEVVTLSPDSPDKPGEQIETWTNFSGLDGRAYYYTEDKWADLWHDFNWNKDCFDGVDWDQNSNEKGVFLFNNKTWGWMLYAGTTGYAYDYLMGADVDYYNYGSDGSAYPNRNVIDEMKAWGEWITKDIGFDGFRLDAVKHIDATFIYEWIKHIEEKTPDKDVFFVGEAWIEDRDVLIEFLEMVDSRGAVLGYSVPSKLKVFDFPLRNHFALMRDGGYDLSLLESAGLINDGVYGSRAVTFIDNHDTDRDDGSYTRSIYSHKYQAYTYILTREEGVPTVFWKDYYIWGMKPGIDKLLLARKYFAYGPGHEMSDDPGNDPNDQDVYAYVREGLDGPGGDGLVMLISDGESGEIISRKINSYQPNTEFYDITGNITAHITTDGEGYGDFRVRKDEETGWSVWVPVQ
jgi:alpha-amylase